MKGHGFYPICQALGEGGTLVAGFGAGFIGLLVAGAGGEAGGFEGGVKGAVPGGIEIGPQGGGVGGSRIHSTGKQQNTQAQ